MATIKQIYGFAGARIFVIYLNKIKCHNFKTITAILSTRFKF